MALKKILSALIFALPFVKGLTVAKKSACAFLEPIVADLRENLFNNECADDAHVALRLLFHDAIGFSLNPAIGGGGADGSIIVFNETELASLANTGMELALTELAPFITKYGHVLSPGDLIQLSGAVSLSDCAGAPHVKFVMGRPQPTAPSPPNLIPGPQQNVSAILARMADAGFSPEEVIALLASHSISGEDFIDPTVAGTALDSTPAVFDTQLYVEVLLHGTAFPGNGTHFAEVPSAVAGTLRLQSDSVLARDPSTACIWQSFINNEFKMRKEFGAALFKMSILGQNLSNLTDCSEVIPEPPDFYGQATFPPTFNISNIDASCSSTPFPSLRTQRGPAITVARIPQAPASVA
jgi:hypothetical protein